MQDGGTGCPQHVFGMLDAGFRKRDSDKSLNDAINELDIHPHGHPFSHHFGLALAHRHFHALPFTSMGERFALFSFFSNQDR